MENKENNHVESGLPSLKISIKKESKSERLARASREIPANFERLRELLDHFGQTCQFCQQAQVVQVEAIFLLSHLLIIHDRQVVKQYLNEDAQDSIFRIKNYMKDAKVKEVIFNYETGTVIQIMLCGTFLVEKLGKPGNLGKPLLITGCWKGS